MQKVISLVTQKLKSHDSKLTPQREQILKVLIENQDKHLSAEDIYNLVKLKSPEVGLATVYRTLELFSDCNIINAMEFGDGRKRYEFITQDARECHHHHHLICLNCGKIIEVNDDLLDDLEARVSEQNKFRVVDHQVKIFGYCAECSGAKQ